MLFSRNALVHPLLRMITWRRVWLPVLSREAGTFLGRELLGVERGED